MSPASSSSAAAASSKGLTSTFSIVIDLCIVFLSHIGYVVQYMDIVRTGNIEGYASLVSLILLTSNTLRIFYFIGERFALALFFQAFVALFVHGALLIKVLQMHNAQLWLEEEANHPPLPLPPLQIPADATEAQHASRATGDTSVAEPTKANPLDTFFGVGSAAPTATAATSVPVGPSATHVADPSEFFLFRVEDMLTETFLRHTPASFLYKYGVVSGCALVFILIVMYGILRAAYLVGYTAMGIEAMLVVPQILRNARRQSTQGLTMFLVFTWVFGDATKIIYFFVKSQPLPFIVCGFLQIAFDLVVMAQMWMYRRTQQRDFLTSGLQGISGDTA